MDIKQYRKAKNCYTGEIDGYGYAFVPGSKKGVVLLDLRTKNLLDNLSLFQKEQDKERFQLLLKNGLILVKDQVRKNPVLNKNKIANISTWLHISNSCNLDCYYCYISGKQKDFMSYSMADAYLDKLEQTVKDHSLKSVAIRFAGGEPTLCEDLMVYLAEQFRKRFIENGIAISLILLTNGTVVNSNLIGLIKDYSMRICLSLDGLGNWHDQTRCFKNGRGSFEIVLKNLEIYLKNEIKPTILTTITEKNVLGIPELSRFLIDRNLSFRYGLYRDNIGGYKARKNFIEKVKNVLDDCHCYYSNAIRNHGVTSKYQFCEIHLDKRPHLRSCNIGYSGMAVNHIGDVYLCQAKMDKEPIGNIKNKDTLLQMVWAQDTFSELQNQDVFNCNDCQSCQWALICSGGCSVTNFGANGSTISVSPYCELFKSMIPKLIELQALKLISVYSTKKGGMSDAK